MHYHIYYNSKIFNTNYQNAISEFSKRLSTYCTTILHSEQNLQFPKNLPPKNHQFLQIVSGPSSYTSEEFAKVIASFQHSGKSNVHILIGFSDEECRLALTALHDYPILTKCSLTKCNLPVATLTLLFYEQLYRSYTIIQGKTYHK